MLLYLVGGWAFSIHWNTFTERHDSVKGQLSSGDVTSPGIPTDPCPLQ